MHKYPIFAHYKIKCYNVLVVGATQFPLGTDQINARVNQISTQSALNGSYAMVTVPLLQHITASDAEDTDPADVSDVDRRS